MLCTASATFRIVIYSELCLFRLYAAIFKYILHCLGIFRVIQAYLAPCVTFVYSDPCHIPSSGIFRPRRILKLCETLTRDIKMECFAKSAKSYNYLSKVLYLRSLTGFQIHPSLSKYSLTCGVISCFVLYEAYSERCLLLYIQIYSGIFPSYSDLFSYIVAYLKPCLILVHSEFRHTLKPS